MAHKIWVLPLPGLPKASIFSERSKNEPSVKAFKWVATLDGKRFMSKFSAEVPFSGGSELFAELTDHPVSDHFMHDTFEDVGSFSCLEDVIPTADEIIERIKTIDEGPWRPVLVVASDGAHVPTREKAKRDEKRGKGRWQEAKGFRIY